MNRVWSQTEKEFIAKNAGVITDTEGAKQLSAIVGRTISVHAWRKQRQKLGQKKAPGRGVCRLAGKASVPAAVQNDGEPQTMPLDPATLAAIAAPAQEDTQNAQPYSDF